METKLAWEGWIIRRPQRESIWADWMFKTAQACALDGVMT